uniref:dihydrofolate reductase n=1 Tax=Hartmannella cantabrigiensis TaxID=239731 RepID=Q6WEA6_HARCA|nr:dihydrofolate reductase [Hartmannella cantabrigiensis]
MNGFALVVAVTKTMGIGNKGGLPWSSIRGDMNFFKKITSETKDAAKQNAVVMGRKTYVGIPAKFRPLSNRVNIVISTNANLRKEESIPDSVHIVDSFDLAVTKAYNLPNIENVFVIGGSSVYAEAMKHPQCKTIYYTNILTPDFTCDTFFPKIEESVFKVTSRSDLQQEGETSYEFLTYYRI